MDRYDLPGNGNKMKTNVEIVSGPSRESPLVDEQAWNAWMDKGHRQDRARRQRLKATVYVVLILASFLVVWFYLRLRAD